MTTKFTINRLKPRNPFVAASYRKPAGPHQRRKPRQQERSTLRIELARLDHERPHT